MPDNYRIIMNDKDEFNARLVGIIGEKDCEAILNTEDAARKITTAENVEIDDTNLPSALNRRFVLVLRDYPFRLGTETDADLTSLKADKMNPKLFISATVERMSYVTKNKVLHTRDKNKYQFVPITRA